MIIGVLSDTHNDTDGINKAIELFNLRNVDVVVHCGDFSLVRSAKCFQNLKCNMIAVFGNNDFDRAGLTNEISGFGSIHQEPYFFSLGGKKFMLSHRPMGIPDQKVDYVLYGHTHKAKINETDGIVILNPGEACGMRYGEKTAAIIDLDSAKQEIVVLHSIYKDKNKKSGWFW
jgi:putative phosphoesterase